MQMSSREQKSPTPDALACTVKVYLVCIKIRYLLHRLLYIQYFDPLFYGTDSRSRAFLKGLRQGTTAARAVTKTSWLIRTDPDKSPSSLVTNPETNNQCSLHSVFIGILQVRGVKRSSHHVSEPNITLGSSCQARELFGLDESAQRWRYRYVKRLIIHSFGLNMYSSPEWSSR